MFAVNQPIRRGMILEWFSTIASIPAGWQLCDGTKGTPDLRDTVPVGAKQDDAGVPKTNMTGALTAFGGNINHQHDWGEWQAFLPNDGYVGWDADYMSAVNDVVPFPYKARVFIMKL